MTQDAGGRELDSNDVFPTREGLLNMWVCAPKHMTRDEVQTQVDLLPPAGTTLGWQVQENTHEEHVDKEQTPGFEHCEYCSPGFCAEDENRQHWNCVC